MSIRRFAFSRSVVIDALLIAMAAIEATEAIGFSRSRPLAVATAVIASCALPFRRRAPYWVFFATVPLLAVTLASIASLIALYTVAERRPARYPLAACTLIVFVDSARSLWQEGYPVSGSLLDLVYATLFAGAPVLMGLLMRARTELAAKLIEVQHMRGSQQQLLLDKELARARTELAREMHDVVSHQVSLIAVQAGALQVTARDDAVVEIARTIRTLSARTLDELRQMVALLRASGSRSPDLTPQPGIEDISALVAASGIDTTVHTSCTTAEEVSATVQRAVYRTIQEGLTNIHRHAPGARAWLSLQIDQGGVRLSLVNSPPRHSPDPMPSDQNGLRGLRERAELLGGSIATRQMASGGYELVLLLPLHNYSPRAPEDMSHSVGPPTPVSEMP
ncbi:sensor histidine kinase [Mycolicibacterium sphagni]|uniref:histidine kinase n=1 Tax=Mycolicibacterium sphagni TaxID=1786 RepID=A0A255DGK2_9MYCO|nr:histidine kinase [Mycolicibacterium sphagni]MCV7174522.1 two-component sensor histidine kinase [Mycolicibacterium sphagni]OYN74753.1 hypothetical protein CG716_27740 [Mycolicibacterium sphagni]